MTDEIHRQYHEVSMIFPLLQGDEFEALKADIAANGLLEAIWLHPNGSILDGRNRHRACIETGTEARFRTWNGTGSLVTFVVSMNLHRRHLTSSQRAVIALDILPMLEAEAKERMLAGVAPDPSQKIDQGKSTQQAAEVAQTNRQYVSDAKRLRDEAPDLLEEVRQGKRSLPSAIEELRTIQQPQESKANHIMTVMGSSESPEWYTPQHIIDLTLKLFDGTIDTDPCSNSKSEPAVPATFLYTKQDDGLTQMWHGAVYMNPPYGSEIPQWIDALISKYENGEIREAIALLPGRTDTRWFQPLYEHLICMVHGRLQFQNSPHSAPFPSVIVYLGDSRDKFIQVFSKLGPILKRIG